VLFREHLYLFLNQAEYPNGDTNDFAVSANHRLKSQFIEPQGILKRFSFDRTWEVLYPDGLTA